MHWAQAILFCGGLIYAAVDDLRTRTVSNIVCIVIALAILYGMYCWMKSMAKKDAGKGPKIIPIIPVA